MATLNFVDIDYGSRSEFLRRLTINKKLGAFSFAWALRVPAKTTYRDVKMVVSPSSSVTAMESHVEPEKGPQAQFASTNLQRQ